MSVHNLISNFRLVASLMRDASLSIGDEVRWTDNAGWVCHGIYHGRSTGYPWFRLVQKTGDRKDTLVHHALMMEKV